MTTTPVRSMRSLHAFTPCVHSWSERAGRAWKPHQPRRGRLLLDADYMHKEAKN